MLRRSPADHAWIAHNAESCVVTRKADQRHSCTCRSASQGNLHSAADLRAGWSVADHSIASAQSHLQHPGRCDLHCTSAGTHPVLPGDVCNRDRRYPHVLTQSAWIWFAKSNCAQAAPLRYCESSVAHSMCARQPVMYPTKARRYCARAVQFCIISSPCVLCEPQLVHPSLVCAHD